MVGDERVGNDVALHARRSAGTPGSRGSSRQAGGTRAMNECSHNPRTSLRADTTTVRLGKIETTFGLVAEADGNRTRRRRGAPSTGFEDRAMPSPLIPAYPSEPGHARCTGTGGDDPYTGGDRADVPPVFPLRVVAMIASRAIRWSTIGAVSVVALVADACSQRVVLALVVAAGTSHPKSPRRPHLAWASVLSARGRVISANRDEPAHRYRSGASPQVNEPQVVRRRANGVACWAGSGRCAGSVPVRTQASRTFRPMVSITSSIFPESACLARLRVNSFTV